MSRYQVVCTEQTGCSRGGHIKSVGTGTNPDRANASWTVREVWDKIDRGDTFYTEASGYTASVKKYDCPCGRGSLRSTADATTANNLDSLRICRWNAA
ncbi:MAG: DUF3892 domain-containing protein [Nocardioides sp.]|uniref:DUF3892 domain-containing protein n=1 Tax=Nocardioides sp. TaxID=35761 RepID=UPI003D6A9A5A